MSTLYRGGFVYSPADPFANAMVVDGGTIAWIGGDDAAAVHADGVDEVVDLDGALVTPAFVDAHAHLSQTGAALRGVDVSGAPTLAVAIPSRGRGPAQQGRPLYAPNWDERHWPERRSATAAELDRATYGGVVYMPRVDGHSAVISSALAAASGAQQQPGWMGEGLVTREAHHVAREAFNAAITPAQRRADIDLALGAAAAAGIGLVQENGGRILSSAEDFADVLAAGERVTARRPWGTGRSSSRPSRRPARSPPRSGRTGSPATSTSTGRRLAHRTRAGPVRRRRGPLRQRLPQRRAGPRPHRVVLPGRHPGRLPRHRDAGVATVVAGIEAAADLVGADVVRRARHRLEHLEMIDAEGISRLVALGITASVQPAFDAHWGGGEGMYAARLGRERALAMNPFATMLASGMTLALGSDSPVTPFAPWEAVRACVNHHTADQRVSARSAFLAHTRGGWRAAGFDDRGYLDLGMPATFTVWAVGDLVVQAPDDRIQTWSTDPRSGTPGLPDLSPGAPTPSALRTVVRGRTVFDAGALA